VSFLKKLLGRGKRAVKLGPPRLEVAKKTKPDHVIRPKYPRPKGFPKKLFRNVKVAGISYRQDALKAFLGNQMISMEAHSEEDNPRDPNAIAIYGTWKDKAGSHNGKLGYLPADIAAQLVTLDPPGFAMRLDTIFKPRPGKNGGLRLSIWSKRGATTDPHHPDKR